MPNPKEWGLGNLEQRCFSLIASWLQWDPKILVPSRSVVPEQQLGVLVEPGVVVLVPVWVVTVVA